MKRTLNKSKKHRAMKTGTLLFFFFFCNLITAQIGTIKNLTYSAPNSYEVADLDNDGDLDIVCRSVDISRKLYWYENVSPQVDEWITHTIEVPEGFTNYGEAKVADFNGDGWQDIFQINSYTFLSNGDPSNLSFTPVEITTINPGELGITGDIDGDNDIDLFRWSRSTGPNNYIYKNIDQDGTFGPPIPVELPLPFTETGIVDAKFFDLDQDNDLDIIVTIAAFEHNNTSVYWYENTDGQGTFEIAEIIDEQDFADAEEAYLVVGHFNNDNLPDIVSANKSGIYFHQQIATGWTTTLLEAGDYEFEIEFGDIDNDGDLDIIEGRNSDDTLNWFKNINNSGVFTKTPLITSGATFHLDRIKFAPPGDFDSDGDLDLIALRRVGFELDGMFFFENDTNTGDFLDPIKISDNTNGYSTPLSFDIELDGDLDMIVLSRDQEAYYIENNNNLEMAYQEKLFEDEKITSITHEDLDLDGDEDILAINAMEELVWYENISTDSIQFSDKKILGFGNCPLGDIVTGDIDDDGDIDISTIKSGNQTLSLYEQISLDNFDNHIIGSDSVSTIAGIADIDQDGLKDIVFSRSDDLEIPNELVYFKQNTPTDYSLITIDEFSSITKIVLTDIDNDLDPDIVLRTLAGIRTIEVYFNDNGVFERYSIESFSLFLFNYDLEVYDLDNDGKKDLYDGFYWFRQLPESTFNSGLSITPEAQGNLLISDLTGDGYGDFIFSENNRDPHLYADNQIGNATIVSGQIRWDEDVNCSLDNNDTIPLSELVVEFEHNGNIYYTYSNSAGYYSLVLPQAGDYTLRVNTPSAYWTSCLNDSLFSIPGDTSVIIDFPVQAEAECPLMIIDISSGAMRPCIEGTLGVTYDNLGTLDAENVMIEVALNEDVLVDGASLPFTETDTSLLFDIGHVGVLESGDLTIFVTPDCDSLETGDEVCFSAYITPDSLCMPLDSLWDGSTVQVNGSCVNDSIHFNLQNIGIGSMDEARQFRIEIVNDDIVLLMQVDTFQLDPEEIKTVSVAAEMDALRLEADQDENHPFLNTASTTVSECADFNFILNLIPDEDANPFFAQHCREVTSSSDPNIKEAIPIGYSEENLIDRSWELEYTIHFQNTGNDTAFNVVIKDPISEHLNLSTLRIGVASHAFNWELNPQRELTFNFNDILLPDSTTNLVQSQGFIQFFIRPVDTVAFTTRIENRAAIYFDFNEPIITDPVIRTIRPPIFANSTHIDICTEGYFEDVQIFNDTLIIDSMLTMEGLFLDFYHIHAEEILQTEIDTMISYGSIFNNVEIIQDTTLSINEISINGCDSIVHYNISILTSTNTLETIYELKIAPIPTNEYLNIQWNNTPLSISLLSPDGRIILKKHPSLGSVNETLDLKGMSSGIYLLKISFPEGEIYKRVVKL